MEKIVTNEFSRILILLGMAMVSLSAILVKLISKVRGSFKPYQKATIIYLLVSLLFFAAIACTASLSVLKDHLSFYIFYQCYFLLLGIAHVYYMRELLKWSGDVQGLWSELIFTLIAGLAGGMCFLIVHRFFNKEGLEYDMVTSLIFFIVPWLVNQTFQRAIAIPPKVLNQWFYPITEEIEEPDEKKLKDLLVISFEFQKLTSDAHYTNFRAKAPADMELGELFYYFVNDYNERHPNAKIQYIDSLGDPHGWTFYLKPKWYTLKTKYIDWDKTIYSNRIKENDVIICSRCSN
jgi:Type VI secretion system, TssN